MDDTTVSKIVNVEPPKTNTHVQSLLQLANNYAKLLPCFSEEKKQLFYLLCWKKEHEQIVWMQECQDILDNIKTLFSSAEILRFPNHKETFAFRTNTINIANYGCLDQFLEGVLHPWLYVSSELNTAKRNYSTVELDVLPVIFTITKLKKYLLGTQFLVQSDNWPLRVSTSDVPSNTRIVHWI